MLFNVRYKRNNRYNRFLTSRVTRNRERTACFILFLNVLTTGTLVCTKYIFEIHTVIKKYNFMLNKVK